MAFGNKDAFVPPEMVKDLLSSASYRIEIEKVYNTAITKILEEKAFKRKEWVPKLIAQEYEPKVVGAKTNISKEETDGDSACCGAGDLDVGAEESLQGTEGHCAWNAKAFAALRREMHRSPRGLKATRGNPGGGTLRLQQRQRARFGKDLELQGKQGLGEKSANLRLNEELLQAREAALNLDLNSKDLQPESEQS
ncbi:LOW QUALITY PROTEIN: coiled-coil domain-containing protein 160 [Spheniscus humboldti]